MEKQNITIRKCVYEDMEVMVGLRVEFLKEAGLVKPEDESAIHGELREYIETHLNKDLHIWLAETAEGAVATGAVCIWDKLPSLVGNSAGSNKIGYVLNMYTKPGYRRMGIAHSVLSEIILYLRQEKIPKAMLHALEAGKGIYKKTGFAVNENLLEMKL